MGTTLTWAELLGGHYRDWPLKDRQPLVYLRLQALTVSAKAEGVLNLAPASRITSEIRDHVRQHRAAILEALKAEPAALRDCGPSGRRTDKPR